MIISLIVAVSSNNIIGKNNKIPWKLSDDLKYFKQKTLNHCIIMGKNTFYSLKKNPLPNRINFVLTRNTNLKSQGEVIYKNSLKSAIETAYNLNENEVFIIGGSKVYEEGLKLADKIYITEVKCIIEGDTYFPYYDKKIWREISVKNFKKNDRNEYDYTFKILERNIKKRLF